MTTKLLMLIAASVIAVGNAHAVDEDVTCLLQRSPAKMVSTAKSSEELAPTGLGDLESRVSRLEAVSDLEARVSHLEDNLRSGSHLEAESKNVVNNSLIVVGVAILLVFAMLGFFYWRPRSENQPLNRSQSGLSRSLSGGAGARSRSGTGGTSGGSQTAGVDEGTSPGTEPKKASLSSGADDVVKEESPPKDEAAESNSKAEAAPVASDSSCCSCWPSAPVASSSALNSSNAEAATASNAKDDAAAGDATGLPETGATEPAATATPGGPAAVAPPNAEA